MEMQEVGSTTTRHRGATGTKEVAGAMVETRSRTGRRIQQPHRRSGETTVVMAEVEAVINNGERTTTAGETGATAVAGAQMAGRSDRHVRLLATYIFSIV